jgi:hypothetical protein
MFESMQGTLNGMFGKIQPGMCRLTVNGNIAVKTNNGFKTYNVKTKKLTNVTNFCFNLGDELFFVIPTTKAEIGDILLAGGKPKCVTEVKKDTITVVNYNDSTVETIIPERHVFMGSTYFYGKIVSMFGNTFKNGKGLGNVMKMMMMSQMFGLGNNNGTNNGNLGGFGQMMAMSMMMGGKNTGNPFEGMFDFDFGFDGNDEDEGDVKETEEVEED